MKGKLKRAIAVLCYGMGVFLAIYVGGWTMLLQPLDLLIHVNSAGNCTFVILLSCAMKILLSATTAGLLWFVVYIGFNHFKGKEDPDWEALEEESKY